MTDIESYTPPAGKAQEWDRMKALYVEAVIAAENASWKMGERRRKERDDRKGDLFHFMKKNPVEALS